MKRTSINTDSTVTVQPAVELNEDERRILATLAKVLAPNGASPVFSDAESTPTDVELHAANEFQRIKAELRTNFERV